MNPETTYGGACLCGAVRYDCSRAPEQVGYCHCRMCQRNSGSAVVPYASFAVDAFAYTKGRPKVYRSSDSGQREFCEACGSYLAFRNAPAPKTVDVNVGTLDAPDAVTPEVHIWCDSRICWFDIDDGLPRFAQAQPPVDSS